LAIAFGGAEGLNAEELGKFLQRAGAITRRSGVELRVIAFEEGSFLVRCKALAKRLSKNAKKEALDNPIRTVLASAAVAIAATALAQGTSAKDQTVTPLASEGARIIEECNVQDIQLITIDETIVLMTPQDAREIREMERWRVKRAPSRLQEFSAAVGDQVSGEVFDVGGVPHFRADGFQFTVPIYLPPHYTGPKLMPRHRYAVTGVLHSQQGQPEEMEIVRAVETH
jgi:hypothetical protein